MAVFALSPAEERALASLAGDLRRTFGARLRVLAAYGLTRRAAGDEPLHTIALVESITFDDLAALAAAAPDWVRVGLAVPLVMPHEEFLRTLDVFPLEYDAILADHAVIEGADPFAAMRVAESDRRRAVEAQAKSHLVHLREGFLEGGRDPRSVAALIAASSPAFRTLLANMARLDGRAAASDEDIADAAEGSIGISAALVREVLASPAAASAAVDSTALLARYIEATERIWRYVDGWRGR
jgi:hypothetical protein